MQRRYPTAESFATLILAPVFAALLLLGAVVCGLATLAKSTPRVS